MAAFADEVTKSQEPAGTTAEAASLQERLKIAGGRDGDDQPSEPPDGETSGDPAGGHAYVYDEDPRLAQIERYARQSLSEGQGITALLAVATAGQLSLVQRYQGALESALGSAPDLNDFEDIQPHLELYHKMMGQIGKFVGIGHLLQLEERTLPASSRHLSDGESEISAI